jgi:hypothetical protein
MVLPARDMHVVAAGKVFQRVLNQLVRKIARRKSNRAHTAV